MANEIQELKFQVGEAWKGVYSPSTAYGLANVVQDPTGLSIYRSLKSGNVGHPLSNASWWFRIIDLSSIKAESDRIAALNQSIAQDEALRVAAEELRQQHEAERVAAETQRNEAEQARISAEQARVNAESARATAEQQRITAEESRVSAESARVQAEQARVLAETLRANAEDQRAANEQNRISAEQQRIERAESDHQRVESDLADIAVYTDSLGAFDLSKHNAVDGVLATYADLSAALTALNSLDSKYKYGGMSFKFVLSSDNTYVQYFLTKDEWSSTVSDWQAISSNKAEILYTAIYGMNDEHNGWPADNGTIANDGGTFYVVPIMPNDAVTMVANPNYVAMACIVTDYNETSFTFATGYSARWKVTANSIDTKTMPSDAHYLLISGSLNTNNYLPSALVINGIDILNKYANTQNETKSNSSLINGISKYDIRDGWPADNGTIINNGGKHRIIPVNTGQVLSVTANNGKNALICIISDYNSSSFHFADGYTARWSVTKGTTGNVIIPLNAKYILVSTSLNSDDYTPSNLTIDGVDVNITIQRIAETNTEVEREIAKNNIAIFSLNSAKQYDGWIGDNGTIDTTRGKYKVIPIENGDFVKVVANSSNSAIIGVAKEFTSTSIVFATGYTGRWITSAGNTDIDIMPSDAHYLLVSISLNDNDYTPLSLQINGYEYMETSTSMIERINSSLNVKEVHCWGDSLTWAGEYEDGIANVLGLATNKVINFGLGSDYSSHIRRRMLSYYQDTTPYTGNTSSSVRPYYDGSKTLSERQQSLQDAFILIFMGTNNIIRQSGRLPQYTLNSAAYKAQVMALYPEATEENWTTFVNWEFDKAMAQAYKDYMLQDLHDMVSIIPHNHWAIITGHGINPADVNNDYLQTMEEVDKLITMTYPDNVINIKQLMQANYEYGGMSVAEDFIKPAVSSSVSIKLNTIALLSSFSGITGGDKICIGTKKEYDTYDVESIDSANNTITAKLIANNASYWGVGDTVRAENALISDNGVDVVMLPTRVYMRMDIQSWNIDEMPRTTCQGDYVHPVNYYYAMGELIGKEIKKIQ